MILILFLFFSFGFIPNYFKLVYPCPKLPPDPITHIHRSHTPTVLVSFSIAFDHLFFFQFCPLSSYVYFHYYSYFYRFIPVNFLSFCPLSKPMLHLMHTIHIQFSLITTPLIHLSVIISTTLDFYSIILSTAQHCDPYDMSLSHHTLVELTFKCLIRILQSHKISDSLHLI